MKTNSIRNEKKHRIVIPTEIKVNQSITGDSIEIMLERIREGEGEDGIADRDLVYNDNESTTVNPLTNIRSDRMELMLEEKIGEYDYKHKQLNKEKTKEIEKIINEENENLNKTEGSGENTAT